MEIRRFVFENYTHSCYVLFPTRHPGFILECHEAAVISPARDTRPGAGRFTHTVSPCQGTEIRYRDRTDRGSPEEKVLALSLMLVADTLSVILS